MGIVVLEADLEVHSLHEVPLLGLEGVLQELRDGVLQGVLWDFPAKNITLLKMNIQLEFGQRRLLAKKKHVRRGKTRLEGYFRNLYLHLFSTIYLFLLTLSNKHLVLHWLLLKEEVYSV